MAEIYDVYFGPTSEGVSLISFGQSELSLVVPYTLEYDTEYSWRVDVYDGVDTTTGDVWTFTTISFGPPAPSLDGSGNANGLNNMVTLRRVVVASNNKIFYET